jgi:hypothetical protein
MTVKNIQAWAERFEKMAMEEHAPFGWTVCRRGGTDKIIVYKRDTPADAEHYAEDLAPFTFPTKREAVESGKQGHYAYKEHKGQVHDKMTFCHNHLAHDRDCDCASTPVARINGKEVPYKMV